MKLLFYSCFLCCIHTQNIYAVGNYSYFSACFCQYVKRYYIDMYDSTCKIQNCFVFHCFFNLLLILNIYS